MKDGEKTCQKVYFCNWKIQVFISFGLQGAGIFESPVAVSARWEGFVLLIFGILQSKSFGAGSLLSEII